MHEAWVGGKSEAHAATTTTITQITKPTLMSHENRYYGLCGGGGGGGGSGEGGGGGGSGGGVFGSKLLSTLLN